jgi:iron-sulfur cluster repair protein YtfE (RIC family)
MLAAYGRLVKQMFTAETPEYAAKQIADIKLFLSQKLVDHFSFEERHIFPALLAANLGERTVCLIATLQEEHQSLRVKAEHLNTMLSDQKLVSTPAGDLREGMLDFLANLQKHTSQEDELCRALPELQPDDAGYPAHPQ